MYKYEKRQEGGYWVMKMRRFFFIKYWVKLDMCDSINTAIGVINRRKGYMYEQENSTLRDKIANDAILCVPKLVNPDEIGLFAYKYEINVDMNDQLSMEEFNMKREVILRYKYADEVIQYRKAHYL